MIARLETKIAFHKEHEEAHAREEAVHARERARHEAEHRKAAEQLAALKAVSAAVGELIADVRPVLRPAADLPEKVVRGQGHWIASTRGAPPPRSAAGPPTACSKSSARAPPTARGCTRSRNSRFAWTGGAPGSYTPVP